MTPRVSVLLPVRDGEAHLADCIASLEAQTLPDVQVVAVDDGSTDATPGVLARWARRDPRVCVIRQDASGIVAALERARAEAVAPWLARMDADDVALPTRLERQLAFLEARPELAACGTGIRYVPREGLGDGTRRYERWINGVVEPDEIERDLFVECPLPHPTFFLRAGAVAAVGGYADRGWPEDYDLLLRLWEAGWGLGKVAEPLLRWRDTPGRLSRTGAAYAPAAFRRCKVHYLARTLLRERDGAVLWGAGPVGKAFARTLGEAGVAVRAFVDVDPRKIGQEIHGAPVVAPTDVRGYRDALVLAAVGQPGARAEIRAELAGAGWREGSDWVAVA